LAPGTTLHRPAAGNGSFCVSSGSLRLDPTSTSGDQAAGMLDDENAYTQGGDDFEFRLRAILDGAAADTIAKGRIR